jgi:tetratricopeptide (TPR) repeat protein
MVRWAYYRHSYLEGWTRGMSRLQKVLLASLLAMFLCHPAMANTSDQEMLAQGKQHLQNHKYSFATTWFERLLKTYPASSHRKEVLHLMAQAYLATDREEKAAEALHKLVKQYPEEAAKLSRRQLELAKRPPRPEAVEQQPAAPSIVISGGLMADKPKPIPIIDPPLENPGGPEGQQLASDGTNIYATAELADNAVDISETPGREEAPRGAGTVSKNEAAAAPVIEPPAVKAVAKPAPAAAAPATAPAKVVPAASEATPSRSKAATEDTKAALAPPPTAPSTTPPATPSPTKPSAAVPSAAVPSAAVPSAAAPSTATPSTATPSAQAPAAQAPAAQAPAAKGPAAAASVAVAPRVAVQSAKATTDTAQVPARAVAPAKPAAPTPAAKAVTVDEKGTFTLRIGEYFLPPEVDEVKKKLVKAGLSPQVVEGRKKMPVVRLEVEGITDQESAQKKLEEVRKASGTGIIVVSKKGKRRLYAGSYLNEKVAEQERQRLAALGVKSSLQKAVAPVAMYSVTAGPFATREAALEEERKLAKEGVQAVLVER